MNGVAIVSARIAAIQSQFAVPRPAAEPALAPLGDFSAVLAEQSPSAAAAVVPLTPALGAGDWTTALPPQGRQWAGAIDQAAREAGVEPRLLAALVWQESGFRADARSHAGATGLAQLMPGTARGLGVDPTDPIANLRGGARYLRTQLDRFGSPELALAAYNAGPGRVAQAGGVPQIAETQTYVRRVMDHYTRLGGTR